MPISNRTWLGRTIIAIGLIAESGGFNVSRVKEKPASPPDPLANSSVPPHKPPVKKKHAPLPPGCKKYCFNKQGKLCDPAEEDVIFMTNAISEKSAWRKFRKWHSEFDTIIL